MKVPTSYSTILTLLYPATSTSKTQKLPETKSSPISKRTFVLLVGTVITLRFVIIDYHLSLDVPPEAEAVAVIYLLNTIVPVELSLI